MAVSVKTKRFTVDEFERMGEVGILKEDDRVELIEGEIFEMAPIGSTHAACVTRLTYALMQALGQSAVVRVQNPILLGEDTEPEPDVAIVQPRADGYKGSHPNSGDIFLLVEVSDSTLRYDRDRKLPLYARAGIPEVWLVDLEGTLLTSFNNPTPDGYRASRFLRRGESLAPLAFPGREIAVDDVLG